MQAGTAWGGEYSRWSFDETKEYILLAKQMLDPATAEPVPLLDDELNFSQELLLTLMRRLAQRIFGSGVAPGDDGFKIIESDTNNQNNLQITGGDGTIAGAGYCFVDGWMCLNQAAAPIEYTGQSDVDALTTPDGDDRLDEVYLDCFLEEVSSAGDADIKDAGLAGGATLEPSRRLKLSWKVKVAEGDVTPAAYTDANNLRHWTLKIAELARQDGVDEITAAMITDFRRRHQMVKRGEFVHSQAAAATWTISHNLGTLYPIVRLFDTGGAEMEAKVTVTDGNTVTVTFDGFSVAGSAVIKGAMGY